MPEGSELRRRQERVARVLNVRTRRSFGREADKQLAELGFEPTKPADDAEAAKKKKEASERRRRGVVRSLIGLFSGSNDE